MRQNDFSDVKPFVLMLANQIKGQNTARVTPRDVAAGVSWILAERAFHAF